MSLKRCNREPRSWALVIGVSTGTGRGFAEELAKRGFNVILLGHKRDELQVTRDGLIAVLPGFQTRILVFDAAHADD